jgi:hypothetical protein
LLSYQKHHAPTQYTIPEDTEYNDNLAIVKPMEGMQSCKYNPIIRITQKPDPVLKAYPLSPLRKITDSLLSRLEENDVKTIVTQSFKHTEQNSVVNLKDKSQEQRRESNQSSDRIYMDDFDKVVKENSIGFEDAYDDSAVLEGKFKQQMQKDGKKNQEESKNISDRSDEVNPIRPISNNNTEHLNPTIDHPSAVNMIHNADASTNTIIISNDIDVLQEKAESAERPNVKRSSVATSTFQNLTPKKSNEMLIDDSVISLVHDLEKDPKFLNDLSALIGEKFMHISPGIFDTSNVSEQITQKNEIIKNLLSQYIKSRAISKTNTIDQISKDELESYIQNSHKKKQKAKDALFKAEDYKLIRNMNNPENHRNINNFMVDKSSMKHKIKKTKLKSSSNNREDSSHSTGATGSKNELSKDKDDRIDFSKDNIHIDKNMNSFLDE